MDDAPTWQWYHVLRNSLILKIDKRRTNISLLLRFIIDEIETIDRSATTLILAFMWEGLYDYHPYDYHKCSGVTVITTNYALKLNKLNTEYYCSICNANQWFAQPMSHSASLDRIDISVMCFVWLCTAVEWISSLHSHIITHRMCLCIKFWRQLGTKRRREMRTKIRFVVVALSYW